VVRSIHRRVGALQPGCQPVSSALDPRLSTGHGFPVILISAALSSRPEWVHGFTGRTTSDGTPLDLGAGAAPATWALAAAEVGAAGLGVAIASQVHGRSVMVVEAPGLAGEGDALISRTPGLLVAVRVADCVPVLIAGAGAVAAVHAGWRGLAAGVIPAAMEALGPGDWTAAVGPRICVDCYEVGEEVVEGIGASVPSAAFVRRDLGPRPHADLGRAAAHQLYEAGVDHVDVLRACTRCDSQYWSHREEGGLAGRQIGLVGLQC